jgi:eukaryotic-like serine/threonine-protein kinase
VEHALSTVDPELRDLASGEPELVEALSGRPTGIRLLRCLGAGGMSTVFLGQLDRARRSLDISELAPRRLAVKILQVGTYDHYVRKNQDPTNVFLRELAALSRMMERTPPCPHVVAYYGSGHADIAFKTGTRRLPWLAIEYVDGGPDGGILGDRVLGAPEGVDPARAIRLLRGMFSGVEALHDEGIIHRDLKPDNVLVTGPIDDETPKLADYGIARVDGMAATIAGMTPAYGGPEQVLSATGARNPLIGPWTDVHALAATAWFLLGGADWCRGDSDPEWHAGARRSLRTAPRLHAAFLADDAALAALDSVLTRAASQGLPPEVWSRGAAKPYRRLAEDSAPGLLRGEPRFASVDEFGEVLFPMLEQVSEAWTRSATGRKQAATAFRRTRLAPAVPPSSSDGDETRVTVTETRSISVETPALPGAIAFQSDGRVLAQFGEELYFFVGGDPHRVRVPLEHRAAVGASRWVSRVPGGGFALAGRSHVLLIRGGRFRSIALPTRASGAPVGEIEALVGDGRVFGIVTEETDDSNGGSELWKANDGVRWGAPMLLPLGGEVRSVSYGPFGFLVVGARRNRARALFLGFDQQPTVYVGVNERSPLSASICGASHESWAAGRGYVFCFDRGTLLEEEVASDEEPVAMAIDLVGVPWLVTTHAILRREPRTTGARWRVLHQREADRNPWIGIGFTTEGARVFDAAGASVQVVPRDIEEWKAMVPTTLASPK